MIHALAARRLLAVVSVVAGLAVFPGVAALPVSAQGGVQCVRCHGDREFLSGKGQTTARDQALFVSDAMIAGSRHADLSCGSCHSNYDGAYPHQPTRATATCGSCHEAELADWQNSQHSLAETNGDGPTCTRCHGVHDVRSREDRASPTYPLNEAGLCGECHDDRGIIDSYFADPQDSVARSAVSRYHETLHGLAVDQAGLVVSATCSSCHRPHRVLPSDYSASSVSRDSIPTTCGGCHVGVLESYLTSSHGKAFLSGEPGANGHEGPVCNTCHSAHGVAPPDQSWKAGVVEECGVCHERLYETYFHTYHGKVTRLGSGLAARCSDCHTPHSNLPADDPQSTVNAANVVDTCRKCHEQANASFVQYLPHGDDADRERYPQLYWTWFLMTSLLAGVFLFFGVHTTLWLGRTMVDRARGTAPVSGARAGEPVPGPGPAEASDKPESPPDGGVPDAEEDHS